VCGEGGYRLTTRRVRRRHGGLGQAGIGSLLDAVIRHADCRFDAAIERMTIMSNLRSVATDRAMATEPRACAEWFVEELRDIGFSANVRDTPGRPIALGHDRGARGSAILFCGHYEVRPAGLWPGSGKAVPSTVADALHQRSADQSIQLMAFIEACRAWKEVAGQLPTPVSVLVEGEGRSGSPGLTSFMRMYADELRADVGLAPAAVISCGTVPTINAMLRGLCCEELTITARGDQLAAPASEVAADPARILARILDELHDPSGRVALPGFYADVDDPLRTPCERRSGAAGDTGDLPCPLDLTARDDQRAAPHAEAMPVWPTCEIECVSGNRSDDGTEQVIASPAFARLSFHLVCGQDPDVVRQAFREFARARLPPGLRIEFASGTTIPALRFDTSRPIYRKAQQALIAEWGQAVFGCGDAAPAIHALREAIGTDVIVASLPERQDSGRGPGETAELASYRNGIHSWARILDALAQ
jgi:acetylornithine deacetylase/succinyl-diaminopimelate desuccinylase-like protein